MAGTGGLEIIIASSKLVEGCKKNGCRNTMEKLLMERQSIKYPRLFQTL